MTFWWEGVLGTRSLLRRRISFEEYPGEAHHVSLMNDCEGDYTRSPIKPCALLRLYSAVETGTERSLHLLGPHRAMSTRSANSSISVPPLSRGPAHAGSAPVR